MATDHIAHELFNTICNKKIGGGMSREVFSSKLLPNSVIKCESGQRIFQNQFEWEIWQNIGYSALGKKWLAPCEWISPCGSVLIMKKTTPAVKYPDKMPAFLTDFKHTNYGMYKGRLVCHDYGTAHFLNVGLTKRMKKADWYEESD